MCVTNTAKTQAQLGRQEARDLSEADTVEQPQQHLPALQATEVLAKQLQPGQVDSEAVPETVRRHDKDESTSRQPGRVKIQFPRTL